MSKLLDFFRGKKDTFVKQVTTRENYIPCELSDGGTLYPSQWDEVIVEEFDWAAFEQAVLEFEESFQEGGKNFWRNNTNKEINLQGGEDVLLNLEKKIGLYFPINNEELK